MGDKHLSYLSEVYDRLKEIEQESVLKLGREKALHFVELANDWIDIQAAISRTYSYNELVQGLVYFYFFSLFKEVQWFQLHFLSGNYPLLGRGLRFVWEMIYRAYYPDIYAGESQPGPSLSDKILWLEQRESRLRWDNCIYPVLGKVLPLVEQEPEVREHYHNLWQSLHKYVHPSVDLVSRMMGESDLLVADSFDETWATEIIQDATEVFDLLWLATISRFPKCAPLLAQQEYGLVCPLTQAVLEKLAEPESGALMSEFRLTITTTIPFLLPAAQEPLNVPISKTNKAKVFITPKGSYPDPNVETTGKSVVRIECGHPFQGSFEEFCDHYGSVDAHEKLLDRTLNVLNRLIEVIRYRTPDVLRVIARRVGSFSIENIHVKASAEE